MRPTKSHNKQGRISGHRGYALQRRQNTSLGASVHALKILGSGEKPQSPQAIRRAKSRGTIRRILRPKRHQITMKVWKFRPNTYDVNLVKRHDDNSAIYTFRGFRVCGRLRKKRINAHHDFEREVSCRGFLSGFPIGVSCRIFPSRIQGEVVGGCEKTG